MLEIDIEVQRAIQSDVAQLDVCWPKEGCTWDGVSWVHSFALQSQTKNFLCAVKNSQDSLGNAEGSTPSTKPLLGSA